METGQQGGDKLTIYTSTILGTRVRLRADWDISLRAKHTPVSKWCKMGVLKTLHRMCGNRPCF